MKTKRELDEAFREVLHEYEWLLKKYPVGAQLQIEITRVLIHLYRIGFVALNHTSELDRKRAEKDFFRLKASIRTVFDDYDEHATKIILQNEILPE